MKGLATLKLRTTILLAILLAWVLMLIFGYGISLTLKENYIKLEQKISSNEMHRAEDAIKNVNNALAIQAANWGVWDAAYQYLIDKNRAFSDKNLTITGVIPLTTVDMMVVYDDVGQLIFTIALNSARTEVVAVPIALLNAFTSPQPLWKKIYKPNVNKVIKGIIYTPEGLLLIGSHSVTKSDGSGPAKGTWIMGERLSQEVMKKIMETTKLDIALHPIPTIDKNSSIYRTYQTVLNTNQLDTFDIIKDINNNPVALLQIHLSRSLYNSGIETLQYFNSVLFFAGLLFALLLYIILHSLIINRVKTINNQVISIQKTHDFNTIIPVQGRDELASVSVEANKMLGFIRDYDAQNKAILTAITHELNESTLLTNQLQSAESFLSDLINSMPSLLIIADKQLKIVQVNNEAEKELHLTSENVKGQDLFTRFPYLSGNNDLMIKALHSGKVQTIDKLMDVRGGEAHYYNVVIFPLNHENLISIRIDDVTQWIKLEETMLQSYKLASIGVLTAGVAHEITDPIHFVLSAISRLRKDLNDISDRIAKYAKLPESPDLTHDCSEIAAIEKEVTQLVDGIQDGISRISTLIKDLQLTSGDKEHPLQKINVNESIDSSLTLLNHRYKGRIDIIKDYGDIPLIDAYPGRLNQVFMNIIANACDAIEDRGVLQIQTYQNDENYITVSIKDNGVGIPAEMLTKIFDPFYTTKEVGKGTGLGLSITSSIIEEIQGQIKVVSNVGIGSEFIITLPINRSH
jgi:PAS domain S-box-containing protein